jgi:hypothetical protein
VVVPNVTRATSALPQSDVETPWPGTLTSLPGRRRRRAAGVVALLEPLLTHSCDEHEQDRAHAHARAGRYSSRTMIRTRSAISCAIIVIATSA